MLNTKIKIGDIYHTKRFGDVKVVGYYSSYAVRVRFSDGTEVVRSALHVRKGIVRNPNHPIVCGVGFMGIGDYTHKDTHQYIYWVNLLKRMYYKNGLNIKMGYSVCDRWLNFQNFAKDFESFPSDYKQNKYVFTLKPFTGNYEYSLDNCCFLPRDVHRLLWDIEMLRGLSFDGSVYTITVYVDGKITRSGTYDSFEKAKTVYLVQKFKHLQSLLETNTQPIYGNIKEHILKSISENLVFSKWR